jgi:hypothetical protein
MNEAPRTVVERWLTALTSGAGAAANDAIAPDVSLRGIGPAVRGRSSVSFVLTAVRGAFLNFRLETEIVGAEGGVIVVRYTARGTPQIPLFGLPSGAVREVSGVACVSVSDRGISDVWICVDAGQLLAWGLRPVREVPEHATRSASWLERIAGSARDVRLARFGAKAQRPARESSSAGGESTSS